MLKTRWVVLSALISFSALAEVSHQEKIGRLKFLESLSSEAMPMMNVDAYRRELSYESLRLNHEKRAERETNLFVEKVKVHVQRVYEAALADQSPGEALAEIKAAIETDLELVSPELREEVRAISHRALDEAQNGSSTETYQYENLKSVMLKSVTERAAYLNAETLPESGNSGGAGGGGHEEVRIPDPHLGDPIFPAANRSKDSERKEYDNKGQVIESLVSDRESTRWVSTSNVTMRSTTITKADSSISLQVKVEFLGATLEAGPTITFKREFSSNANIMAEGNHPPIYADGNFDFAKRDKKGNQVVKNGEKQSRFVVFNCDVNLDFETDYTGAGGFSAGGLGSSASYSKKFVSSVNLASRRIMVPSFVGGQTVTIKYLANLCHNDFLSAPVSKNMTVKNSLETMMRNVVSGLKFSHPKTKCVQDSHCYDWFNTKIIGIARARNTPRCVQQGREKFMTCEVRGTYGQNCSVYEDGERVSDGMFEFTCDKGYTCVKVKEGGWFTNWEIYDYPKGECRPINKKK